MNEASAQAKKIHQNLDKNTILNGVPILSAPKLTDTRVVEELKEIEKNGFVILRDVLTSTQIQEIKDETNKIIEKEKRLGRNNFEGRKTSRPYGILGKSRIYDQLLIHPRILSLLDQLLHPNYLVTASQAISIHPGETPQPVHYDDSFCYVPRPRKHLSVATIWAIDPFTEENGGTVLYPGSHLWGNRDPTPEDKKISCVMPAGSVAVFVGTLWHGGGKNLTQSQSRLAVTFQYCEPFIRPQENQFLSVPFPLAKQLHPKIQSLLGYSIHPPFIGHSNGLHPLKALSKL